MRWVIRVVVALVGLQAACAFALPTPPDKVWTSAEMAETCLGGRKSPNCPVRWIATPSCPDATQGVPYPGCSFMGEVVAEISATCSLATGDLRGLSVASNCSGIPAGVAPTSSGPVSFTVTVTDGGRTDTSTAITFNVAEGGALDVGDDCLASTISAHDHGKGTAISITIPTFNGSNTFNWSFASGDDGDAACGRFANGDYWVAPRSGQTSVKLVSSSGTGGMGYAVDENPQIESQGLLNLGGGYNAAENVLSSFPKEYTASVSLVGAIQRETQRAADPNDTCWGSAGSNNYTCIESTMTLTVLSEIPAGGGKQLLPPPVDETVKVMASISDFDLSRLLNFSSSDYTGASDSEHESQRIRWNHSLPGLSILTNNGVLLTEGGRAFTSTGLTSSIGYAAAIAQQFGSDLATHWTDDDDCTSEACLMSLYAKLNYGQNLFWAIFSQNQSTPGIYDRVRWLGSGAGQAPGRFPAVVLHSALRIDTDFVNTTATIATLVDTITPGGEPGGAHELEQLNVNPSTGVVVWGDTPGDGSHDYYANNPTQLASYWKNIDVSECFAGATGTCNANFGSKNQTDPTRQVDGPANKPGTSYQIVSAGPTEVLATMALNIDQACEAINYAALITYVDRLNEKGVRVGPDTCAPVDPAEDPSCDQYPTPSNCTHYGLQYDTVPTYGPTSAGALNTCIANNSGGNTGQTGRFSHLATVEGNFFPLSFGYASSEIHAAWSNTRTRIGVTCSGL